MSFLRKSLPSIRRSLLLNYPRSKPDVPFEISSFGPRYYRPFPSYSFLFSSFAKPFLSGRRCHVRSPFRGPTNRSYFVGHGTELQHFGRGRGRRAARWYSNPRTLLLVVVLSGGAAVTIYYGNLETVPYTKRSHFVLVSNDLERQLGEHQFEQLKSALQGKILPAMHPDSVRVRLISRDIILALQRGLRHDDRRWKELEYASESPDPKPPMPEWARGTLRVLSGEDGKLANEGELNGYEEEILNDRWVHESRRKAANVKAKKEPSTAHLEDLKWEVLVVRDEAVNAFCLPGGKIVVFTVFLVKEFH